MAVDESTVRYIAGLSRLAISNHEAVHYAASLSRILKLVEQMHAVDTRQVEPLAHPQDSPLTLRDDQVTETDHRDTFMALAPATEDGLYLVPKVIE
ncbi:MAG TPA: Asp-tRNA(Asn)/Glu-tRNA(Gln) amidotransferase subunit GatC [Gammaproteobacteria bacterium]|nr:Asp-tRNA(Asn)/Glu-tRNA(Gln) amidotransferase subunit GatC [Gammaproteobacteria bacterium]